MKELTFIILKHVGRYYRASCTSHSPSTEKRCFRIGIKKTIVCIFSYLKYKTTKVFKLQIKAGYHCKYNLTLIKVKDKKTTLSGLSISFTVFFTSSFSLSFNIQVMWLHSLTRIAEILCKRIGNFGKHLVSEAAQEEVVDISGLDKL